MLENRSRSSAGAGPGRIVVALLLAVAVAFAVRTVLNRRASQAASTADLSFDAGAARHIDAGLAAGADPAVALAQSILTDATIAGLSKPAYLSSNGMANRIGEFRSRLELTQPSAGTLRVGFRDPDPVKAAETANTVAKTLAAWTPGAAKTGAAAAPSAPAATAAGALEGTSAPPPAAPTTERAVPPPAKVAGNGGEANHGLSDALGQLGAELSATNRKLEGGGSAGRTRAGRHSGGYGSHEEASYSQSKQQQMLKSEVRTAEKRLDDLRAQYANRGGGDRQAKAGETGVKERLAEIQGALTAVWPGRGATRNTHGFYSAGTSASQIRQERAALVEAIDVVERQRQAIRKEEDAAAASSDAGSEAAAAPSPAAAPSAAAAPASSAVSEPGAASGPAASAPGSTPNASTQPGPLPGAEGSSAASGQPRPLTMARAAGAAPPVSWLPAAGAGSLFGLLSLGIAAWRNRPVEYAEAEEEETPSRSGYRLITPEGAVPVAAAEPSAAGLDYFGSGVGNGGGAGAGSSRRASFSYEPPPAEGAAPGPARPVEPARPGEEVASGGAESLEASREPGAVMTELSPPGEFRESQQTSPARVDNATGSAEMDDGWTHLIQKAISETDIAKRFEKAGDEGGEAGGQRSNFSDRRAG
jgi:hypothetical protein